MLTVLQMTGYLATRLMMKIMVMIMSKPNTRCGRVPCHIKRLYIIQEEGFYSYMRKTLHLTKYALAKAHARAHKLKEYQGLKGPIHK